MIRVNMFNSDTDSLTILICQTLINQMQNPQRGPTQGHLPSNLTKHG